MQNIKPREWKMLKSQFTNQALLFDSASIPPNETEITGEFISVREILPGISDSERLDWMIENRMALLDAAYGEWWLFDTRTSTHTQTRFKSPREAIDAAILESRNAK